MWAESLQNQVLRVGSIRFPNAAVCIHQSFHPCESQASINKRKSIITVHEIQAALQVQEALAGPIEP